LILQFREDVIREDSASVIRTGNTEAVAATAAAESVLIWSLETLVDVGVCSAVGEGKDTGVPLVSPLQGVIDEFAVVCPA
jgi:hypothetical protein